jgi:hypothetical protein
MNEILLCMVPTQKLWDMQVVPTVENTITAVITPAMAVARSSISRVLKAREFDHHPKADV